MYVYAPTAKVESEANKPTQARDRVLLRAAARPHDEIGIMSEATNRKAHQSKLPNGPHVCNAREARMRQLPCPSNSAKMRRCYERTFLWASNLSSVSVVRPEQASKYLGSGGPAWRIHCYRMHVEVLGIKAKSQAYGCHRSARTPRVYHMATLLRNGRCWWPAAYTFRSADFTIRPRDVDRNRLDEHARYLHTATLLPDGTVLVGAALETTCLV